MGNVNKGLIGLVGLASSVGAEAATINIDAISEAGGLITQLAILIATIISLFKKKKPTKLD